MANMQVLNVSSSDSDIGRGPGNRLNYLLIQMIICYKTDAHLLLSLLKTGYIYFINSA
ncbi:MAG TPA: hypothetical protein VJ963_00655 [Bacteroidales bacterium]|nr:hypothetical protein [Bacteroidales bacterium]